MSPAKPAGAEVRGGTASPEYQPVRLTLCLSLVLHCLLAAGCGGGREAGGRCEVLPEGTKAASSEGTGHGPGSVPRLPVPAAPEGIGEPGAKALEWLEPYLDRDLSELGPNEKEDLACGVEAILPAWVYDETWGFHPWHIWKLQLDGKTVYWILDYFGPIVHPGSSQLRVVALGVDGKQLAESTFKAGYRCYAQAARLAKPVDPHCPLLILDTSNGWGPGPGIGAQCYTMIGDSFALVRLEDPAGSPLRNDYSLKGRECGPALPKQTASEWEGDLLSDDRQKVLRALVWLGGVHWDGRTDRQDPGLREDSDATRLVRRVREKSHVETRLRELAGSNDRWEREAAVLALQRDPGR